MLIHVQFDSLNIFKNKTEADSSLSIAARKWVFYHVCWSKITGLKYYKPTILEHDSFPIYATVLQIVKLQ